MADSKITALDNLTTADPANDMIPIVDVSATPPASGNTKRISINNLLACSPSATLASATITGDLTVDTSTLKVNSSTDRVGIKTTNLFKPLTVEAGSTGSGTINQGLVINSSAAYGVGQGVSYSSLVFGRNRVSDTGSLIASCEIFGGNVLETSSDGGVLGFRTQNTAGALTDRYTIDSTGISTWSVGGTTAMTLNSTGLGIGVTPAGTGGCLQLKSGITFPATQVASSDANTLDDYEEGTWTGTIGGATTNPTTPVTSTGRYTKIGRQVSIEIGFYGDTTGASGRITVSGLPFTSNASLARPGAILMDTMGTFTGSPVAFLGSGVTSVDLYSSNSNGPIASVTHNTGAGRALYMELTYTV